MTKKTLLTFLTLLLCFSLAGCGLFEDEPKNPKEEDRPAGLVYNTGLEPLESESRLDEEPTKRVMINRAMLNPVLELDMEGNEIGEEFYFYRSTLSENYQKAYDFICNKIANGVMDFDLGYEVNKDDFMQLYTCIYYDHPEFFWLEHGFSWWYNSDGIVTHLWTRYNNLGDDIDGNREKIDNAVSGALAEAAKLKTQAEQVKYIHDYLRETIEYQLKAENNQCIFSSLVAKKTVCAGYSRAFQYCMQKLHIPAAYICGNTSTGGYHAWNMVKIGGEYYMMDVTWDDQPEGYPEKYYYEYFDITEEQLSKERTREALGAMLPNAVGIKYCWDWFKTEHPDVEPDSMVGEYAVKPEVVDVTPTEEPAPTDTTEPTDTPEPTEEPVPTDTTEPTDTPEPTEEPVPTDTTEPTDTPKPTEEPVPTGTTEPTDTPEPTEEPVPTGTTEPTDTPEPTEIPTITVTPIPTEIPVITVTPEPTSVPVPTKIKYYFHVEDENGNSVSEARLSVCSGDLCSMIKTDINGDTSFEGDLPSYEVSVISLPEDYAYEGDTIMITREKADNITIVVKTSKAVETRERFPMFAEMTTDGQYIDDTVFTEANITMINFWEPWCGPCIAEIPEIEQLYKDYKEKGFQVIGVFGDYDYDDSIVSEMGMTYPNIHDYDFSWINDTGYIPCTIFVDDRGYYIYPEKIVGGKSYEDWYSYIKDYLK